MAILKRLDYLIKETSSGVIATQQNSVLANLNEKQTAPTNAMSDGHKVYYYATLFDPRDKKEYYVFADAMKAKFELTNSVMDVSAVGGSSSSIIYDGSPTTDKTYSSSFLVENFVVKQDIENDNVDIAFLLGL